jgi:hypothetical protein
MMELLRSLSARCGEGVGVGLCAALWLTMLLGLTAGVFEPAAAEAGPFGAALRQSRSGEPEVARGGGVRVAAVGAAYGHRPDQALRVRPPTASSHDRPQGGRRHSGTRVASLGSVPSDAQPQPRRSLSGGSVVWLASAGCLNGTLRRIITELAASYGPVTVNSTCRSRAHNRRVGGAPRSMHLTGDAADFRLHSNFRSAYAALRGNGAVGGLKHYGGGLFHIDTGPRRSW